MEAGMDVQSSQLVPSVSEMPCDLSPIETDSSTLEDYVIFF